MTAEGAFPYAAPVQTLSGAATTLEAYRGKLLLIVNVASKCGFTPQYEGLERLQQAYSSRGFSVLAFPCNQFGAQEPGDEAEIRATCDTHYHVSFPVFAKIEVNGPAAHPLFRTLTSAAPGIFGTEAIKWNFTKFLIGRSGFVLHRFAPTTKPEAIAPFIESALALA